MLILKKPIAPESDKKILVSAHQMKSETVCLVGKGNGPLVSYREPCINDRFLTKKRTGKMLELEITNEGKNENKCQGCRARCP